jgi:hypothetical protein
VPQNTIIKIGGWKTDNIFRRYDIQSGRDIRQAAATMEQWIAQESGTTVSTISSTIVEKARSASKRINGRNAVN